MFEAPRHRSMTTLRTGRKTLLQMTTNGRLENFKLNLKHGIKSGIKSLENY